MKDTLIAIPIALAILVLFLWMLSGTSPGDDGIGGGGDTTYPSQEYPGL